MVQTLLHSTDLFNEHIWCIQALSHSHTVTQQTTATK